MKTDVVAAGWGQITQPKYISYAAKDPMGLMVQAAEAAAASLPDAALLKKTDGVMVVKSLSAYYSDPATDLARALDLSPEFTFESKIGGNSPQTLINRAAGMIARRELNMVLIAGAEAYVPRHHSQMLTHEKKLDSALLKGIPEDYQGDDASGVTPLEITYGIEHPMQGFPLFETALWGASGLGLEAYLSTVADFWADFSRTAAGHPYSWTRQPRTPEEILTVSETNRPIAFPYPKFMNAFVTVDMGAAVILMSAETAEKYGTAKGKTVYFCGGGYAEDRQPYMIQKSDFTASPPLEAAVTRALDRAGMTLDEIEAFDLYSCFPCAVSIARKMIGIPEDDPRPQTLTGGLGFFGGPGNNYNLHAVATLCGKIAAGELTTGLTTALGWFMMKHAAGVYSALPPKHDLSHHHSEDLEDRLAGPPPVEIDDAPEGGGIIETYTIVYNRDMRPAYAVIYGITDGGKRFIARTPEDKAVFRALATACRIGDAVRLETDTATGLTVARFAS
jgi:acetyl-CoA C-acetyltransferase